MGKSNSSDAAASKKYGVPLYGAAWVPHKLVLSSEKEKDGEYSDDSLPVIVAENYVVLAGGGGEGRSGIPNAIILSHFDFSNNSLSDQPVSKLGTSADLPYRMAVHPGGVGLICSLPKSCRWFTWDEIESVEVQKLGLKLSKNVIPQLQDIGQQLAVKFNNEGSILAIGGENGHLRVLRWPSMDLIIDEAQVHSAVKDLDFSSDGKFLISLGSGGPCRVWDVTSSAIVASLPKQNDEVFGFCRFSQINEKRVLYTTVMRGQGGSIVTWETSTWKRVSSKQIVRDAISAFCVSEDGNLLAIGTVQGDVVVINSATMRRQTMVRKAHIGLVTALSFSKCSRALLSASLDSSARVTPINEKKTAGFNLWIFAFALILAVAAYVFKTRGIIRTP